MANCIIGVEIVNLSKHLYIYRIVTLQHRNTLEFQYGTLLTFITCEDLCTLLLSDTCYDMVLLIFFISNGVPFRNQSLRNHYFFLLGIYIYYNIYESTSLKHLFSSLDIMIKMPNLMNSIFLLA